MAKKRRIPLGHGSISSVLAKNVHPSAQVRSKFPNLDAERRLEGAVALRLDDFRVHGKQQLCVVFMHNDFPGVELYVTKRFFKVTSAPPDGNVFDGELSAVEGENEEGAEQPSQHVFAEFMQRNGNFDQCDLQEAAEIIENIDDDNAPAPENIPTAAPTDTIFQGWGHSGQCKREKDDVNYVQP